MNTDPTNGEYLTRREIARVEIAEDQAFARLDQELDFLLSLCDEDWCAQRRHAVTRPSTLNFEDETRLQHLLQLICGLTRARQARLAFEMELLGGEPALPNLSDTAPRDTAEAGSGGYPLNPPSGGYPLTPP